MGNWGYLTVLTHTIHVGYIYLHLVDFYGNVRNIPYMDGMGFRSYFTPFIGRVTQLVGVIPSGHFV